LKPPKTKKALKKALVKLLVAENNVLLTKKPSTNWGKSFPGAYIYGALRIVETFSRKKP
jgi:hypothetical protein